MGSKYHDFIQSADRIANMQRNAKSLVSQLRSCLSLSGNLVEKSKRLLEYSTPTNDKSDRTGASVYYGKFPESFLFIIIVDLTV